MSKPTITPEMRAEIIALVDTAIEQGFTPKVTKTLLRSGLRARVADFVVIGGRTPKEAMKAVIRKLDE